MKSVSSLKWSSYWIFWPFTKRKSFHLYILKSIPCYSDEQTSNFSVKLREYVAELKKLWLMLISHVMKLEEYLLFSMYRNETTNKQTILGQLRNQTNQIELSERKVESHSKTNKQITQLTSEFFWAWFLTHYGWLFLSARNTVYICASRSYEKLANEY